ncbi:transglycosylase SLT domain-containing protein [Streptomyces sp. TLI_171]|uniref:transglycosylase SLT domain-containing protein n=1 Tax=Streptomyces sp. TLI_171 TaxID=1938859 RepID=UPI000C1921BE|nr:transglycosylase SLT domain-containing protein [Streptomyces sp. TLI_171]RKE17898.1 transglycosylase-like protein with SLT domain [Streptomyces sp. TLI_171]
MAAGFGVELGELAKIQRDFQQIQQRMGELNKQTGQIKSAMARAVATDVTAGLLGNVLGAGLVIEQVRERVGAITERMAALEATKKQLTENLAEDAKKLGSVLKQYQEAEKRAHEGVDKPGKGTHPGRPKSPNQPGQHKPGGGQGGHHGGTHPSQPKSPNQPGGHHGNDPKTEISTAGKIATGDVTYGGKGKFGSGEAACRDYIAKALDAMGVTDPAAREAWTKGMLTIAKRESSYNAPTSQVNLWDTNAHGAKQADGAPLNSSRGGWQTIPSTFAAYHVKGTSTDIYDPVANVAASMNYIRSRYHVSPDGHDLASKVQQADPNRSPRGY